MRVRSGGIWTQETPRVRRIGASASRWQWPPDGRSAWVRRRVTPRSPVDGRARSGCGRRRAAHHVDHCRPWLGEWRRHGAVRALGYASAPFSWSASQILSHFYSGTMRAVVSSTSRSTSGSTSGQCRVAAGCGPAGGQLFPQWQGGGQPNHRQSNVRRSDFTAKVGGAAGDVVVSGPWSTGSSLVHRFCRPQSRPRPSMECAPTRPICRGVVPESRRPAGRWLPRSAGRGGPVVRPLPPPKFPAGHLRHHQLPGVRGRPAHSIPTPTAPIATRRSPNGRADSRTGGRRPGRFPFPPDRP